MEDLRRQQLIDTIIGLDQTRGGHALRRIDESLKQRLREVPDQEDLPSVSEQIAEVTHEHDRIFDEDSVDQDALEESETIMEESFPDDQELDSVRSLENFHAGDPDLGGFAEEKSFAESILSDLSDARGESELDESEETYTAAPIEDEIPLSSCAENIEEMSFAESILFDLGDGKEEGQMGDLKGLDNLSAEFIDDPIIYAPKATTSGTEPLFDNERLLTEVDDLLTGLLDDVRDFRTHVKDDAVDDSLSNFLRDQVSSPDPVRYKEPRKGASKSSSQLSSGLPTIPKKRKIASQRKKSKPGSGARTSSMSSKPSGVGPRKSGKESQLKPDNGSHAKGFRSRLVTGAVLGAIFFAWQVYVTRFSL